MRPGIKIQSQTNKKTFENQQHVQRLDLLRFRLVNPPNKQPNYPGMVALKNLSHQAAESKLEPTGSSQTKPYIARTALLARRIPIDMSLPGEESPSRLRTLLQRAKWRKIRLIATRSLAVGLVLIITLGGLLVSQSYLKLHKVFRASAGTAEALKVTPSMLKGQSSGRVNILILGRDGGSHKDPDVTNTMILASIDVINHQATMISLPSNLWVNAPNAGVMDLSQVWQKGEFQYQGNDTPGNTNPKAISVGFNLVDQTVNQVLGLNVDYNVIVNLQAVKQMVDTLGGITINAPSVLTDPTMAWQNNKNPLLVQSGTQTLNGNQALLYVMSKETTSNAAREQRQRAVLVALMNKIMSVDTFVNPFKLSSIIDAFGNNVSTDLSMSNAGHLYSIINGVNSASVSSLDLSTPPNQLVNPGNLSGQAISLPAAGLFNYAAIQQFVSLQLKDPVIVQQHAKILILNGTDTPGLAANVGNQLKTYGYNVISVGNAPTNGYTTTSLYSLTKSDSYSKKALAKQLKLAANSGHLDKSIPTDGADFVIIIGTNEVNTAQNQAN